MTIGKTGLALVVLLALAGCRVEVYDKLSQRDANEITALLLSSGIDANRLEEKDGTFAVEVPEKYFAQAVNIISDSGLPRPQFRSMVDVFDNDRLISSPSEERARLGYAVSQELSQTVSEIDGVVSARVHLATPALDPLGRRVTKSSASVAIHHEEAMTTEGLVPRIKLLVSHAVDDLEYDDVLVALFPVGGSNRGTAPVQRSPSSWNTASSSILDEMARPGENAGPTRVANANAAYVAPASMSEASPFSPAVAAILAGGLLVLLIAAKSLFDRPAKRVQLVEDDRAPSPKRSRRRA